MSTSELIQHDQQQAVIASPAQSFMNIVERVATMPEINMDALERMLDMQERIMKRDAEAAFNEAMARMQCEMPTVGQGTQNEHTKKFYANLDDINRAVKDTMSKFGFGISFKIANTPAGVSVTGILMHKGGHREETSMLLPVDIGPGRNAVQAVGSSTTYGKRYVMCALLNITTGDAADDDGQYAMEEPTITALQAKQIAGLLPKCSKKAQDAFTKLYPDIELIERKSFDTVLNQLTTSAQKNTKAQEGAE